MSSIDALTEEWIGSRRRQQLSGRAQDDIAEQFAYDALVDYVEAHDLNGTSWDPR